MILEDKPESAILNSSNYLELDCILFKLIHLHGKDITYVYTVTHTYAIYFHFITIHLEKLVKQRINRTERGKMLNLVAMCIEFRCLLVIDHMNRKYVLCIKFLLVIIDRCVCARVNKISRYMSTQVQKNLDKMALGAFECL